MKQKINVASLFSGMVDSKKDFKCFRKNSVNLIVINYMEYEYCRSYKFSIKKRDLI